MPASRRWAVGVATAGSAALLGVGLAAFSPAFASPSKTVFASPTATATGAGTSCATAKYTTISAAVASAPAKGTVVACPGTYTQDVVIQKPLKLIGRSATINAAGLTGAPIGAILGQQPYEGVTIEASNVTVKGFTVENAEGEGILAVNPNPVAGPVVGGTQTYTGIPLKHITIEHNVIQNNNVGYNNPASPYIFCTPNGGSDCGGGIHLLSVADSTVRDNTVTGNADGILLTDEFGPNHDNLVKGNYVEGNTRECGIVLPGHNIGAVDPTTGKRNPSFGGVYRNTVIGNIVIANGVKGYGSGIGLFAPESGTASYNNTVSRNFIEGNGLAGISVHSHQANAYVNGNQFTYNTIGTNNVDLADGTDTGPIDNQTTGILIWSVTKYHVVVAHNKIFANTYGVWYTPATISISGLHTNHYYAVTTPVFLAS